MKGESSTRNWKKKRRKNGPMVGERSSKSSEVNLRRRLLLPTPESPIINNLNK
jgi:hypothetical protein